MYQQSRWSGQESIDSSDPEPRVRLAGGPPVPAKPLRRRGIPPHAQLPRGPRTRDNGGFGHPETRDAGLIGHFQSARRQGPSTLIDAALDRTAGKSSDAQVPSGRATPALSTTRTRTFGRLAATSTAARSGITANAVASASASVAVGAITETLR